MNYEVEYNNRARVPEHPQIIEGWQRASADYREGQPCELDLSYGGSERSKLDLFWPGTGEQHAPLAVFLHGGYWQALDRKAFSIMAQGLNRRGVGVAVPSYDLCPETTIANIIDQVRQCCLWLWRRFDQPMTLYGHSAGGHLTAALMATDWTELEPSAPAALTPRGMAISGLFELQPLIDTSLNDKLGLDEAEAEAVSPLGWTPLRGGELIAVVGGDESSEFLRQSKTVCEVWRTRGVRTRYLEVDGANHFTVIDGLTSPDNTLVRDMVALSRATTPGGP